MKSEKSVPFFFLRKAFWVYCYFPTQNFYLKNFKCFILNFLHCKNFVLNETANTSNVFAPPPPAHIVCNELMLIREAWWGTGKFQQTQFYRSSEQEKNDPKNSTYCHPMSSLK
uniref:Protein prenyltransferase alpha subunit repeat containing 1 n=1 Tax=Mus musculus TaxID=10090 RepID=Q8C3P5_MOUSE|nr:unnamed protein product [Mus musculus]